MKNKAKFNERMGRQKFSKGGLIKKIAGRHYFDDGGSTTLSGPAPAANNGSSTTGGGGVISNLSNALGTQDQFQAGAANIQQGTNVGQLNSAYQGAQTGLTNQTNLTNTLQPQAATAVGSQNALTAQELAMSQGQGPNPAQAQLAQNTNTNVNNQAALMAGQRGGAQNVGLLARQAGQAGAGAQQQAVGQAATQEATQQINAQNNLANLANQQVNQAGTGVQAQNTAQQNEQGVLQGANSAANNAAVAQQSNINNVGSQTAQANQSGNKGILAGVGNAVSSILGGLAKGGEVKPHHVQIAEMNAASMAHLAAGGSVAAFPSWGGSYNNNQSNASAGPSVEATSAAPIDNSPSVGQDVTQGIANYNTASQAKQNAASASDANFYTPGQVGTEIPGASDGMTLDALNKGGMPIKGMHQSHVANFLAMGGAAKGVPAMVSPGERYLSPQEVDKVIKEGANPYSLGKKFPGKAKVKGDSLKNDIDPRTLEEGGVVIKRSVENAKNRDKAELFVRRAVHMRAPK